MPFKTVTLGMSVDSTIVAPVPVERPVLPRPLQTKAVATVVTKEDQERVQLGFTMPRARHAQHGLQVSHTCNCAVVNEAHQINTKIRNLRGPIVSICFINYARGGHAKNIKLIGRRGPHLLIKHVPRTQSCSNRCLVQKIMTARKK